MKYPTVLKYVDESGECHVTLHCDLADAQTYRALIIAKMIYEGVVGDSQSADVITDHIHAGEYGEAYEEFVQWMDKSEDADEYFFDIRETNILPPTTYMDVERALLGGSLDDIEMEDLEDSEVSTEFLDIRTQTKADVKAQVDAMKKHGVFGPPPPLTTTPKPLVNILTVVKDRVKDIDIAASGATLGPEREEVQTVSYYPMVLLNQHSGVLTQAEERALAFGYGKHRALDDFTTKELREYRKALIMPSEPRSGRADRESEKRKRRREKKLVNQQLLTAMMEGKPLTEAFDALEDASPPPYRDRPSVTHNIKPKE